MSEYIIINRTSIEKRIEELRNEKNLTEEDSVRNLTRIRILKEIISQSTPLIPEIEKSWEAGYSHGVHLSDHLENEKKKEYVSKLKFK